MSCLNTAMSKVIGYGQCQKVLIPAHTISQKDLPAMPQPTQMGKTLKERGPNYPGMTHRIATSSL